ncbi:MAG: bifunctional riboflavin kinase/FAD synthetase [Candidatus Omnitrophota bacterium]
MLIKKISDISRSKKVCVSIGIFDGVHLGHQKILKKLVKVTKELDAKSLVITFYPHPRKVLDPDITIPFLTSIEHKKNIIEKIGIDYFLALKFTKGLARMDAVQFIEHILLKHFNLKGMVVGKDFLFGNKKKGDFSLLKKIGKSCSFIVYGIDDVKKNKRYVSSTRIRKLIEKGTLKDAEILLGRKVTVFGTVVKGRRVGRDLGFPTANINPHHESIPPSGVYAVDVLLNKSLYRGVLNIGTRPTFMKDIEPTIELHILDFKKNVYGKDVEIMFIKKLRNELRFKNAEALKTQIKKDISHAKQTPYI